MIRAEPRTKVLIVSPTYREAYVFARESHLDPRQWVHVHEERQLNGYDPETTRLCVLRMYALDDRQIHLTIYARKRYYKTGLVDEHG